MLRRCLLLVIFGGSIVLASLPTDDSTSDLDDIDDTGCSKSFLGRCYCGKVLYERRFRYVLNCSNTGFRHTDMLGDLPPQTEVLIFTGNVIETLPWNVFGKFSEYPKLEVVDLSNNNIREIKGKAFHKVYSVKRLILNHNDLYIVDEKHHPRMFSNFENLEELHLTNAFTERVDSRWYLTNLEVIFLDSNLDKLIKLHLEQNEIWSFRDPNIFCQLPKVEHLYLGDNRLNDITLNISCMERLTYLDLEYNSIRTLDNSSLQHLESLPNHRVSSFSVNLLGNPFKCDCDIQDFYRWLQTTNIKVINASDYRCFDGRPKNNRNKRVLDLTTLQCPVKTQPHHQTTSVVLTVLVVIMCFLLVAVIVVNRNFVLKFAQPKVQSLVNRLRTSRQYSSIDKTEAQDVVDV